MAKVDVFVPCYNYGRYLPACVASILGQSMSDVRVLIIDDASTDDSAAVARALAAADSRVSVLVHERNRGHIATYNEGIDWADSDCVLLLSADDMLAPGALQRAVDIFDAHPEVVLVHGDCIEFDQQAPTADDLRSRPHGWTRMSGARFVWEFCCCGFNVVHTPTAIARTSIQKKVGGYRPELPHSGDMEMFMRFAAHGDIAQVHAVQAFKREHRSNMSVSYLADKWRDCAQRKAAFDSFFHEFGACIPNAASMKARANREMAESAFWIGLSQLIQGRLDGGRALIRFALDTCPELRFRPPVGRLMREPRLLRHAAVSIRHGLARMAQRKRLA